MDVGKETIKAKDGNRLLDLFQFVGISRGNRISDNIALFRRRSNYGKIRIYKQPREDKEKTTLRTRHNNLGVKLGF
jgi:hypothetical protein